MLSADSKLKLLCVEDDSINSFILNKVLSKEYDITIVEDGSACLDMAKKVSFDIVLMDINLGRGKMDGVEILEKMRSYNGYSEVPIYAVTSYAMPGDEDKFLDKGFNGYFSKPLDIELLKEELNKYA